MNPLKKSSMGCAHSGFVWKSTKLATSVLVVLATAAALALATRRTRDAKNFIIEDELGSEDSKEIAGGAEEEKNGLCLCAA
jgi:uncharacterized membrane protein